MSGQLPTDSQSAHWPTLEWLGDERGCLRLIDQTKLPREIVQIDCKNPTDVWEAIRALSVRGAPAIGVAAAYGVVLGLQQSSDDDPQQNVRETCDYLATSRPTAVNLFWALDRMRSIAQSNDSLATEELLPILLAEARTIEEEDRAMCAAIGRVGAELLTDQSGVLTHCNAGALATAGDGTALSVIYAAANQGKILHVYADETRPLLQGARLTAWELSQRGIQTTLICDSVAASAMQQGKVQAVVTGADRIAANGDAANKIGTYPVAVLAREHGIPFYVAAPSSTFDMSLESGSDIPIEERAAEEVSHWADYHTSPDGIDIWNPAFDVTPAKLIAAIITERGLIRPVNAAEVRKVIAP